MKSVQLIRYVESGLLSLIAASLVAIAASSFSPHASALASPPQFDLSEIKSHFASFENHRIHYKSHGAGDEALVFIHGGVGNMNIWRLQVPAFKGKKRIILIDLPGHGQSDKPRITYSMDIFARAIDAVLTEAKVKKAVLIGISMGTPVIRQFYRLYPEKTKALVFIDGPLRPLAPSEEIGQEFIAQFRGPDYMESAKRFNAGLMTAKIPADMREQILASWADTPQHVILSVLEQVILPNAAPAIWKQDQIKAPVLAVYTKNPYVPEDNEQFLRSMAPATEYHAWGDVGHAIMVEKPDEFNETLQNFLAKQKILSAEAANRLWLFQHVQVEPALEDQFEEALRGKAQAFTQAQMGYEQSWFVTHRPVGNYTIVRPINSFVGLDRFEEKLGPAERAIGKAKLEELIRQETSGVRATQNMICRHISELSYQPEKPAVTRPGFFHLTIDYVRPGKLAQYHQAISEFSAALAKADHPLGYDVYEVLFGGDKAFIFVYPTETAEQHYGMNKFGKVIVKAIGNRVRSNNQVMGSAGRQRTTYAERA